MTAEELIEAVEVAGGTLAAKGDKLACEIPPEVEYLIPELQTQKAAVLAILRQRSSGIPWPGYNHDRPFVCKKCGTHFDTSAGFAKHQVYVCGTEAGTGWSVPTSGHCDEG